MGKKHLTAEARRRGVQGPRKITSAAKAARIRIGRTYDSAERCPSENLPQGLPSEKKRLSERVASDSIAPPRLRASAVEKRSLSRARAGRRWLPSAFAHALAKALALLGRHGVKPVGHAVGHAIDDAGTHGASAAAMPAATAQSESPHQDASQRQHSPPLPAGDGW